jgi:PAS domain S-box-containing protein
VYPERHLQRSNRRLAARSRVNHAILKTRDDKQRLLAEACQIIHSELSCGFVWLGELLADGQLQTQACTSSLGDQPPAPLAGEIPGWAAEIARNAALAQIPVVEHRAGDLRATGAESGMTLAAFAAPLSYSDLLKPTLVLVVGVAPTQELDDADLQALRELNGDLGLAVDSIAAEERSKRAEQALRISEDRFRRLAEHSLVGIVLIQNDLYRYVNPAFVRIFGYSSPLEIIDRLGPLDLAAPESREVVAENVAKRVSGQVRAVRYQYRGLRKDGTTVEIEEHGARTIHAQRTAVIATVMDITAREASRRRLEALSHAGLALARTQTPQQALEQAAEQIAEIWPCIAVTIVLIEQQRLTVAVQRAGADARDTVGARIRAGATVADLGLVQRIFETREAVIVDLGPTLEPPRGHDGATLEITTPGLKARPGAGIPLMVRDELIGFIVVEAPADQPLGDEDAQHLRLFADHVAATYQHLHLISDLEEERNRLRTLSVLSHTLSETLLLQDVVERAVQQTSRALQADISLLYVWDPAARTLVAVAAEGLTVTALSRLNARLRHNPRSSWSDWMAPAGQASTTDMANGRAHWAYVEGLDPKTSCTLDQALEARGETVGFIAFSRQRQRPFDAADVALISTLSVPIALAIQNVRFYEWITHQAEMTSEALHRQEELDRMKDELIQNISHELRTPLALVMGYAEMLDSGQLGPVPAQQADAISVIARRSRMLRSLVEDISLLWNVDRTVQAKEVVDLRVTVETAIREFASQAREHNLELHGEWPDHPVIAAGVPIHIRRVLDNLIGNALKFTPPGGKINVRLSLQGEWATLSVTDTGIGVPGDKLSRIFERFYQVDGSAKRRYGGTGLGLALVKAIIEAHGGTIQAISPVTQDPGRPGTEVTIRLPALSTPQSSGGTERGTTTEEIGRERAA